MAIVKPNTVLDIDRGWGQMMEEIPKLNSGYVLTGIQQGEKRDPPPAPEGAKEPSAQSKTPPTMPEIAFWQEFGTLSKRGNVHTPARPFMRTAVDSNEKEINNRRDKELDQILLGKSTVSRGLDRLGLFMVGLIQQAIINLKEPKNADYTIAKKGSSNPLVDTGQMFRSIKHLVKVK